MDETTFVHRRLKPLPTNTVRLDHIMGQDGQLRHPADELLRCAEQCVAWLDRINLGSVQKHNLRLAIEDFRKVSQ